MSMTRGIVWVAILGALGLTSVAAEGQFSSPAGSPVHNAERAVTLRARGVNLGYNLDHPEAMAAFDAAIAADPDHPAAYRLAAAAIWTRLLFQQGAVTVEDYLGQARTKVPRPRPPPEPAAAFRRYIDKALVLSEERLRRAGPAEEADARYHLGATIGVLASYRATIEGRVMGGIRDARRAFDAHQRVLALAPGRKDAGMIVGTYRYAVSTLPFPVRWLAHLAGLGGGRERGLRMVEQAARYPSDVQANAMFTLVLLNNRERRYDEALRGITALQQRYPRNRLLWLEAASTALRAHRFTEARQSVEDGLVKLAQDPRPRAFGEEARWYYALGLAHVGLGEVDAARVAFQTVVEGEALAGVRGRAHLERGRLATGAGIGSAAAARYRLAEYLCHVAGESACAREARSRVRDLSD